MHALMTSFSDTSSTSSSSSSAFSFTDSKPSVLSKLAGTVRDTRTKVEQKKTELNATMHERLPEWRSRGVMVGNRARETSMEWSRKGKEAVDRWKKDRQDRTNDASSMEDHAIFGMALQEAVSLTKLSEKDLVPAVLRRCINYLDEYGIHEVGIYRIPGSTLEVNKMRSTFDSGHDSDLFATRPDPNAVATLLKMYIRELPDPIIPEVINKEYKHSINQSIRQKQHQPATQSSNDDNEQVESCDMMMPPTIEELPPITPSLLESIRTTTSRLPPIHLELLKVLCQHLKRIAGNADENKMSTSNLALIFIPTLGMGRLLFHCMVDHYNQVFSSSSSSSAGPTHTHTRSSSASTVAPFNKPLPPPLPHKPKHINVTTANSSSSPWRQNKSFDLGRHRTEHTKTLSDTDIKSMITPPPKPPRSPVSKLVNDYFKPGQTKARSKSVSSSSNHQIDLISPVPIRVTTTPTISPSPSSISSSSTIALRSRSGSRVEAIGRQFEQLGKKSSGSSSSSSSNKAL